FLYAPSLHDALPIFFGQISTLTGRVRGGLSGTVKSHGWLLSSVQGCIYSVFLKGLPAPDRSPKNEDSHHELKQYSNSRLRPNPQDRKSTRLNSSHVK